MYSAEQIRTAESHLANLIRQNRAAASQYESFLQDYKELDDVLTTLPGKIRHPIMVPISNVAFMEGYIEQTNELTVLLGDNYFVKCTTAHAQSILKRRVDFTQSKLDGLNEEYKLVKSRVGLARDWLEVDTNEELEDESEPVLSELKMPTTQAKTKPKIEIISSTDTDEGSDKPDADRQRLLDKIRELEESGIEMTDEELAEALGVPIPEFPGDLRPVADQEGMVEITEVENDDGSVESFVRPKVGAKRQIDSKMKKVVAPMIQERNIDDGRDVVAPMVIADEPKEEEQPKRVSKFKAMREQGRG